MAKKDEIVIEGVAIRTKEFQGMSQAEFTESMNAPKHKHLWKDAENRDAIIAEAYGQLNPQGETTDGAASAVANGDTAGQETPEAGAEAPAKRGRSGK